MSNKIDSPVGPAAAPAAVRPVLARTRDPEADLAPSGPAGGRDSLRLTGEGRVMHELEQRVNKDSGVDENKVAEVRRILAQGLYNADPAAIAGRLMQVEWSLGQKTS